MPVPLLRPSVLNPRLSRHCIFAKSSSPVYAFGQRSCRAEVLFEWSCCVGIHDKDGVVPVNPDSVFLSAERITLSLLISSYIAKFLAIVCIRSRRSRYSRPPVRCSCPGSCRLGYSRMYPAVVLGFRPRFSIMFKLLQFIRFWETMHTCVVADVSAVPSNSPCSSLWIHDSLFTVIFTSPQVSLCPCVPVSRSTSYCKFDSDLVFVQSLFTVFCWSGTESYFRDFFFRFGVWSSSLR